MVRFSMFCAKPRCSIGALLICLYGLFSGANPSVTPEEEDDDTC